MTIDSDGNVYLTGHGVTVFDKTGKQVAHIPIAEDWTGNVCFGGADRHTLFITASKGLYAMQDADARSWQPVVLLSSPACRLWLWKALCREPRARA